MAELSAPVPVRWKAGMKLQALGIKIKLEKRKEKKRKKEGKEKEKEQSPSSTTAAFGNQTQASAGRRLPITHDPWQGG